VGVGYLWVIHKYFFSEFSKWHQSVKIFILEKYPPYGICSLEVVLHNILLDVLISLLTRDMELNVP